MKIEVEGLEFANFLRLLEWFIQTVKGQNNFWNRMLFRLIPGGSSDLINQNSNWKKIMGIENHAGRGRKL